MITKPNSVAISLLTQYTSMLEERLGGKGSLVDPCIPPVIASANTETKRDPVGLFSPQDFPWVLKGRLKQLLLREGNGCNERLQKQGGCRQKTTGQGPGSTSRDTHSNKLFKMAAFFIPDNLSEVTLKETKKLISSSRRSPETRPEAWRPSTYPNLVSNHKPPTHLEPLL